MFKVVRKQTRPNTNVHFWQGQNDPTMTDDFRNYFYENYILTGKFISSTPSLSSDGLELSETSIWATEADYEATKNDPMIQTNIGDKVRAICVANGITQEEVSRETF